MPDIKTRTRTTFRKPAAPDKCWDRRFWSSARRPQRGFGTSDAPNAVVVRPWVTNPCNCRKGRRKGAPILVGVDTSSWRLRRLTPPARTPPLWRFGKPALFGESSLRSTFFEAWVPDPSRGLRPPGEPEVLLHRTSTGSPHAPAGTEACGGFKPLRGYPPQAI